MKNVNKKTRTELLEIAKRVKEDQVGFKGKSDKVQSSDRLSTGAKKS